MISYNKTLAVLFLALPALAGPYATGMQNGPFPTTPAMCARVVEHVPILLNGWENYGDPFAPAMAWKDCYGVVHLAGGIRNGTAVDAFVLPEGFRPAHHEVFPAGTTSYKSATVYVTREGIVSLHGDKTFISLSGISYRAAP